MAPRLIESDLLKRATLFTMTLSQWGNRKKADMSAVKVSADKRQLSLTKHLIESDELVALRRHLHETKAWCMARCMPSFLKAGIYVVKLDQVPVFEEHLAKSLKKMRDELVPAFVAAYPDAVTKASDALGDLYDQNDYPAANLLTSRFDIDWAWIGFGVPENIPAKLRQQEADKLRKKFIDAEQEILFALREGFKQVIEHAVERLKIEPGKKPPIIKESLVANLSEFFETFEAKNLMDDDELAGLVEKAKAIIGSTSGETLRKNPKSRKAIAAQFEDVKATLDKMLVNRPARLFDMDEA
jgi:hypothetical protein